MIRKWKFLAFEDDAQGEETNLIEDLMDVNKNETAGNDKNNLKKDKKTTVITDC